MHRTQNFGSYTKDRRVSNHVNVFCNNLQLTQNRIVHNTQIFQQIVQILTTGL